MTSGEEMMELLRELVDENAEEHSDEMRIILIDPDEHPLMLNVWEDMFGIDIEEGPQIGLVDLDEVRVINGLLNVLWLKGTFSHTVFFTVNV